MSLASIYDGGSRANTAGLGSVTVQIVRDWAVRFNDGGPDSLINGKDPGKPSLLNDEQRSDLAQAIEHGPTPYLDRVVRWHLSSGAMDLVRAPHLGDRGDPWPRSACRGLTQALGAPKTSYLGCRGGKTFENFLAAVAAAGLAKGKVTEIWFNFSIEFIKHSVPAHAF